MLNVALFGPPGAGKGTQSARLIERYGLLYVATGDLLRAEIREGTDLGKSARAIIERGGLVSDEIIVQILEHTIRDNSSANGFLFDGFPRTFVQAYILEGLLLKLHTSLMNLVSLEVPEAECLARLLERARTSGRSLYFASRIDPAARCCQYSAFPQASPARSARRSCRAAARSARAWLW